MPGVSVFGRRSHPVVAQSVIKDRCWADPVLDRLCDAAPRMAPAARVEAVLQHLRPLRAFPDHHTQVADALDLSADVDVMRSRLADPGLHPHDRADLLALLGGSLAKAAWKVRSAAPARFVQEGAWAPFHEILQEADEVLQEALRIHPAHSGAATSRLRTARGLGATPKEWWARFEAARLAQPTLYKAHDSMLQALCAKWYGSNEQMFDFGHRVAEQAPPGDPVVAMLPLAHVEYFSAIQHGRQEPGEPSAEQAREQDEDAVMAASWKWAGDGSRPAPAHPYALEAHNLFAWFLGISTRYSERGRWHLEQAQQRLGFLPWIYLSEDPSESFAALHQYLGVQAAPRN